MLEITEKKEETKRIPLNERGIERKALFERMKMERIRSVIDLVINIFEDNFDYVENKKSVGGISTDPISFLEFSDSRFTALNIKFKPIEMNSASACLPKQAQTEILKKMEEEDFETFENLLKEEEGILIKTFERGMLFYMECDSEVVDEKYS